MEPLKAKRKHEMMKQASVRALSAVDEPVKSKLDMWVFNTFLLGDFRSREKGLNLQCLMAELKSAIVEQRW